MNYYLLGTGRMAHFLAARLSAGGHTCTGLWGRNTDKVFLLAQKFGLPVVSSLQGINDGPDACFFALSDDAIAAISSTLRFSQTVALHLSGTLPIDALLPAARRAVCWPVYSITAETARIHQQVPCIWDSNSAAGDSVVMQLSQAISGLLQRGSDGPRAGLHLAAVFANNFSNHMLAIAEKLCAEQGLPFSVIHPLIRQTMERALRESPAVTQTGPARRGDEATVAAHIERLSTHLEWAELYRAISKSIAGRPL